MSEVLFFGCFYRCSSACINGLISPRREVQNMLFICFRVWPMPKPLRKITCFEESSFRFREIVKRRGYHTLLIKCEGVSAKFTPSKSSQTYARGLALTTDSTSVSRVLSSSKLRQLRPITLLSSLFTVS